MKDYPFIVDMPADEYHAAAKRGEYLSRLLVYGPGGVVSTFGDALEDVYIRSKTREEIAAMTNFPFGAADTVRFHGSDGVVLGDGTLVED